MHLHTENKFKCMVKFPKVLLMPFSKNKKNENLYQDSRFHLAVPLKSKDIKAQNHLHIYYGNPQWDVDAQDRCTNLKYIKIALNQIKHITS